MIETPRDKSAGPEIEMTPAHRTISHHPPALAWRVIVVVVATIACCSCGSANSGRKPTYPVLGEVYVDGKPAADLAVTLHDPKGMDTDNPTISQGRTDEEGKIRISTYDDGDGAPAGAYVVTFQWNQFNTISMGYEGDKLKGKYSDPKKSEHQLNVEEETGADMGRVELSTK